MNNLAGSYAREGRYEEAYEMQEVVYEKRGRILGATHPHTLRAMYSLGLSYLHLDRLDEGFALWKKLQPLARHALGV